MKILPNEPLKFGPPEIGETVDTIFGHVRYRGQLTALEGDAAYIAVLQMTRLVLVPFNTCAPVR
jgi:hypothetical protein